MSILRMNQIKLPVQHSREDLDRAIGKRLSGTKIPDYRIVKQSLDARDKANLQYIYSVEMEKPDMERHAFSRLISNKNIMLIKEADYDFSAAVSRDREPEQKRRLTHPPVIVGTGPAGLFCGYQLAKAGYQPMFVERGLPVWQRQKAVEDYWEGGPLQPDCNVQFGEGGAGTFSDGKLNTMIKDKAGRIDEVLRTFAGFGAASDILYVNKPHIGTDDLQMVVQNMRSAIQELGGQVRFNARLTDFRQEDAPGRPLCAVTVQEGELRQEIPCECLILAVGHSARDTFYLLQDKGLAMEPKAFAVGLRIEHTARMIQKAQYGDSKAAASLPAADYKLTFKTPEGRGVYSFCMCPGGHIIDASSEPGGIVVNGMSYRSRNAVNSNSAIVVNVTPEDFSASGPLGGVEFQRKWEQAAYRAGRGRVPLQLFGDYQARRPSVGLGGITPDIKGSFSFADLNDCLPKFINDAIIKGILSFDRQIPGFAREDAVLCGIESRTSSPVRLVRNQEMESNIPGIYPCGEGAGYAGGITSAAVDGIRTAEAVAAHWIPKY